MSLIFFKFLLILHLFIYVSLCFLNVEELKLDEEEEIEQVIESEVETEENELLDCTSSWASRTSLFYRRRWLIETGFSDLNRINHRWKSNYDNLRYLDMLARMLLYNSWKMNKKLIKTWAKQEGKVKEWTLNQNQDYLKELFLTTEKKSQGVIG